MALGPILTREIFDKAVERDCAEFVRYLDLELEKIRSNKYVIDIKVPPGFNSDIHFETIKSIYLKAGWKNIFLLKHNVDPKNWKIRFTIFDDKNLENI